MKWPDEVSVLEGGDIYQGGAYSSPDGKTHCIVGWAYADGVAAPYGGSRAFFDAFRSHAGPNLVGWNDSPSTKKSEIAKVYNRTTALLGYTVGNPEAKWLRTKEGKAALQALGVVS